MYVFRTVSYHVGLVVGGVPAVAGWFRFHKQFSHSSRGFPHIFSFRFALPRALCGERGDFTCLRFDFERLCLSMEDISVFCMKTVMVPSYNPNELDFKHLRAWDHLNRATPTVLNLYFCMNTLALTLSSPRLAHSS